jgi:peptidoglycan endopeptidase LytE
MRRFYLFVTVSLLAFFISSTIYADTTYTIKRGDNPSKLAKKFKVGALEIMQANNLRPENLKVGAKIIIPSKQNVSSHKEKLIRKHDKELDHKINIIDSPKTQFTKRAKRGSSEDSSFHLVKKGDTLLSLSKKYSIPVSELKEINNLSSTKLRLGQQILLERIGPRTYTVQKGDNIYKIAKRFHKDVDELRDTNVLETDVIKPGQKILLEPEAEQDEPKTHETILSQTYIENEVKQVSKSEDLNLSELSIKEKLTLFAKKLLNIPYRFGGSSLLGIDCSAFVQKVYSLIGINLPRSAREQFSEGNPVNKGDLSIGDLVFFRTYASFPSHVGIYLGNNLFIHASSGSRKVTIDSLETPYYLKRFIGAKRLIDGKDEEGDFGRDG